jgi:hypothetical protein
MINWGKLVSQGRAKAFGVSWNKEEEYAIHVLGIPAESVRLGILTLEECTSENEDKTSSAVLKKMNKEEIKSLATEMGISFPDDAKRLEIISLIKNSKLTDSDHSDVQESLE